jgi:GT2 family glycosyltransferase
LWRLAACLLCYPDRAVGGYTVTTLPHNPFSAASQILIDYLYSYYNANALSARFLTSNNLALSAALFRAVGGFDTTMPMAAGEDREFCDRWLYHGFAMILVPEAVVHHSHELTLLSFWKQHFRYGRGARLFHLARSRRRAAGIHLEPLSFYLNLLGYPLIKAHNGRTLLLTSFLLLSQWANAAGFIWQQFTETNEIKTKRLSVKGFSIINRR